MNSNLLSNPISSEVFTSIDLGTNSFKLLIVQAEPSGRSFVPIERLKEPVVLSRESPTSISSQSQARALQSLRKFKSLILSHHVSGDRIRCVATEALRRAENQEEFVDAVFEDVGLKVDVLSGEEEARLCGYKRDWRFGTRELSSVVAKLCSEGDEELIRREGFFKRRSEFIVAGAVLLEEIFKALGIEDMEVSEYALAEGVIADSLAKAFDGSYDLNANARWRSVMRLATRFNGKKRMTHAIHCAKIAKEIYLGLRKCNDFKVILDDKDLEYLEAACFLHNIGIITGKKGYHKQSYHIIKNGDHLHSYTAEEIELIAMLVRYQRKKFPKLDRAPLKGFTGEAKRKFIILCLITRLSVTLQRNENMDLQEVEFIESSEIFKLVLKRQHQEPVEVGCQDQVNKNSDESQLEKEVEHFKRLYKKEMVIVFPS
ncbi:putative guanosine-5'-triphosphate,3'-diphosphate diphosphatase [Arabidopsis thaliana]